MKCLFTYEWVKLPRAHIPTGKGLMGSFLRLASRAAFRSGKARYCGYTNDVNAGAWAGGIVGLKSILGIQDRKQALLVWMSWQRWALFPTPSMPRQRSSPIPSSIGSRNAAVMPPLAAPFTPPRAMGSSVCGAVLPKSWWNGAIAFAKRMHGWIFGATPYGAIHITPFPDWRPLFRSCAASRSSPWQVSARAGVGRKPRSGASFGSMPGPFPYISSRVPMAASYSTSFIRPIRAPWKPQTTPPLCVF